MTSYRENMSVATQVHIRDSFHADIVEMRRWCCRSRVAYFCTGLKTVVHHYCVCDYICI